MTGSSAPPAAAGPSPGGRGPAAAIFLPAPVGGKTRGRVGGACWAAGSRGTGVRGTRNCTGACRRVRSWPVAAFLPKPQTSSSNKPSTRGASSTRACRWKPCALKVGGAARLTHLTVGSRYDSASGARRHLSSYRTPSYLFHLFTYLRLCPDI